MRYLSLLIILICFHSAKARQKYFGRNAISVSGLINNTGPGYGVQYEHFFRSDKFSITAAVNFCFSYVEGENYRRQGFNEQGEDQRPLVFFVAPGVRYYPTGSSGTARYAVGGFLFRGEGKGAGDLYVSGTNQLQRRSLFGVALSNSINFHITRHVRFGLDLALGICSDDGINSASGPGTNPFGQLSINLGGRLM